jgi:hypothetical protein
MRFAIVYWEDRPAEPLAQRLSEHVHGRHLKPFAKGDMNRAQLFRNSGRSQSQVNPSRNSSFSIRVNENAGLAAQCRWSECRTPPATINAAM